jgi:hypothetical protein
MYKLHFISNISFRHYDYVTYILYSKYITAVRLQLYTYHPGLRHWKDKRYFIRIHSQHGLTKLETKNVLVNMEKLVIKYVERLMLCFTDIICMKLDPDVRRGSSFSIVSGYGLNDRTIEVQPRQRRKDFPVASVQTGSGVHRASCKWVREVLSPGLNRGRGVTMTTQPHLVPRSRMSRSYTSSPPKHLRGV